LGVCAITPALLSRSEGRLLSLPLAAPALGGLGIAPLFPALAALAATTRERFILGAAGYAWLSVAEVVLHRTLLLGPAVSAPAGWQESVGGGLLGVLGSLIIHPSVVLMLFLWGLAAVVAGVILAPLRAWKARKPPLDGRPRLAAPTPLLHGAGRQASLP